MLALAIWLLLGVCLGGAARAQSVTGDLQGTVFSPEGTPEPDVAVLVTGPHLQGKRSATTDHRGFFQFLAATPPLAGQESPPGPRGSFGLALSVSSTQWRDRVLNPARHTGWSPSLDLTRSRRGAASSSRFQLGLAFSPLNSRFDPTTASFGAGLSLGYRREHGLGGTSGGVQVALGGQLRAAWDFAYFDNWDDSHFYWLTSYALGFAGSVSHALSPGRSVSLEWDVPVVAVVSRPRERILYKVQEPSFAAVVSRMHRDMKLTSLHEHRALDLTLRFNRLRARLGRSLFWRFQYLETDLPYSREVQILRHSFGATLGG